MNENNNVILNYPNRGEIVYLFMKSSAIYQGIFWRYMEIGGGRVHLSDVRCCDRENKLNVLVSPKKKVNRNFWCSKIAKIEVLNENDQKVLKR